MAKKLIKVKRDTATRWAEINPILSLAEPGYDVTNNRVKYGNGITAWNELPYEDDLFTVDTVVDLANIGRLNGKAITVVEKSNGGLFFWREEDGTIVDNEDTFEASDEGYWERWIPISIISDDDIDGGTPSTIDFIGDIDGGDLD